MELLEKYLDSEDPAYIHFRDTATGPVAGGRDFVNKLWKVYEPYADNNFRTQLAQNFDAKVWEMYLTCVLIENDFPVKDRKSRPSEGPDILITDNDKNLWIEAIATSEGESIDKVPKPKTGISQRVPGDKIILRFTNAFNEKFIKYESYIKKGIINDAEPYIIAINGGQIQLGLCEDSLPRILKSLLPIGRQYVSFSRDGKGSTENGYYYRDVVEKTNRSSVRVDTFFNPKYSGVSAVLYSNADWVNHPVKKGQEFVFIHNPMAKNPLSKGFLKIGREYLVRNVDDEHFKLDLTAWDDPVIQREEF